MHLHVFDLHFNRLGIIKSYDNVITERYYYEHDALIFELKAKLDMDEFTQDNYLEVRQQIIELLFTKDARDEGRIICKSTNLSRGYIVRLEQALDEVPETQDKEILQFTAFGLKYVLRSRAIPTQQVFNGTIEDAARFFVDLNCINPSNPNRVIQHLVLGNVIGLTETVEAVFNGEWLDEALFSMLKPHEATYDILMDHENKQYVFTVFRGDNRSAIQDENEPVIFAKKFGNVASESFIDDRTNECTTVVVVGLYEESFETDERLIYRGDNLTGLNRWETVVDARNEVKSYYTGPDDIDYSMTEQQFDEALQAKGDSVLSDYKRLTTMESQIISTPDYELNRDYFVGDVISTVNHELGVQMHSRVIHAIETETMDSYELEIELGDGILSFNQALKRELKHR